MPAARPPFVIHANLDCEARWAGGSLPAAIATRVSSYAALVAALAPGDVPAEVWAPAAIDPDRLVALPTWAPPAMRVGTPARADLVWAQDTARNVNDRRLAHEVAVAIGAGLPGARTIESLDELAAAVSGVDRRWVVKAPWTTAGRDRCHGDGPPTPEQVTRVGRLLDRFGALVFEPWLDRVLDVGACARVAADGTITPEPPHGLVTDARGTFLGIDLAPPALSSAEHALLARAVHATGAALAARGYAGPFAIDAFAYAQAGERRFHPLCEINARLTFGAVARALSRRLGATRLGFGAAPPEAQLLVTPARDGVVAWIA